jgi:hypothetical protein
MMTLALASTYDPSPFTRRGFLSGAAALLATSLLPRGSFAADGPMARDFFTPDENARRRRRQLDEPLIVGDDTVIADTDFVVGTNFKPSTVTAAIYLPGQRVVWRNSRLVTDFPTWNQAWAANPNMYTWAGVRIAGARGLIVDGLHVEGFPHCGVQADGLRGAELRRLSGTRCFWIFAFGNALGGSRDVSIDGLRAWDTWGPGPGVLAGIGGAPSRLRPGGWSGAGGLAAQLSDSVLRNLDISGELDGGLKFTHSHRVQLYDSKTNRLMVQGTEYRDRNVDGTTDGSSDITVRRLIVDKRRGTGDVSDAGNGVQVSYHVSGLDVEEYSLLSGGSDGHAIQLAGNCDASFKRGVISSWNGHRGTQPAAALDLVDNSKINDDFGDDGPEGGPQRNQANKFHNQIRIRA